MSIYRGRMALALAAAVTTALLCGARSAPARESNGTPEAQALVKAGEEARRKQDNAKAIEAFRRAIELDPDYAEAHSSYLFVRRIAEKGGLVAIHEPLLAEYEAKMAADPKRAVYIWALSEILHYADPAKSEKYLRQTVELDPTFARAWQSLSFFAEFRGENAASREYMKKAAESNPEEPSHLFYYARAMKDADPAASRKLSLEVVARFPKHERGAQSLYWLANDEENMPAKLALYERLRREYPPAEFSWSASGMRALFEILLKENAAEARAFAADISKGVSDRDRKTWDGLLALADSLDKGRELVAAEKYEEAEKLVADLKSQSPNATTSLNLLKAAIQHGLGRTEQAFSSLAELLVREPNPDYEGALAKYGARLRMTPAQMGEAVWSRRDAAASPAVELDLENYTDGRKVKLADYAGHVILLNFWYPG